MKVTSVGLRASGSFLHQDRPYTGIRAEANWCPPFQASMVEMVEMVTRFRRLRHRRVIIIGPSWCDGRDRDYLRLRVHCISTSDRIISGPAVPGCGYFAVGNCVHIQ